MFFLDRELLESFPKELISQFLSKKVYSVMLSLPTVKYDVKETDDPNPPEPVDNMGVIEQRMSTVIYGNCDPFNPSPNS